MMKGLDLNYNYNKVINLMLEIYLIIHFMTYGREMTPEEHLWS